MLKPSSIALPAICLPALAASAPAKPLNPQDEGLELRVTAAADRFLADSGAEALVVVVQLGGDPLLDLSRGTWPDDESAGPETQAPAGWLLEAVLGARLLELAGDGDLRLDDTVLEHIPGLGWDAPGPTLRQLAGHCAGVPALEGWLSAPRSASDDEQAENPVVAWAIEHPPAFAPGSCFEWSEGNLLVLGACLATATEQPLGDFMDELLRSPFSDGFELTLTEGALEGLSPGLGQLLDGRSIAVSPERGVELVRSLGSGTLFEQAALRELRAGVRIDGRDRAPMAYALGSTQLDRSAGTALSGSQANACLRLVHYLPEDLSIAGFCTAPEDDVLQLEPELVRLLLDRPGPAVEDRPLTVDELAAHAGTYQVGCDTLRITVGRAHLALQGEGFENSRLLNQGGSIFLVESDPETRLRFDMVDGVASGFQLEQRGTSARAVRVE